jgi:hypothetical protein
MFDTQGQVFAAAEIRKVEEGRYCHPPYGIPVDGIERIKVSILAFEQISKM